MRARGIVVAVAATAALGVAGWTALGATKSESKSSRASAGVSGADFVLHGPKQPSWLKIPTSAQLKQYPGNLPGYYGGVTPVNSTDLKITPADIAAIRAKHWKAAFLNWSGVPYNQAFTAGMKKAFGELGIKLVATTDFEFDATKASSQLNNVLPLNPNIIITGVLDPAQWPGILKPAVAKHITIEMWSQGVKGWTIGKQLCNVTTYDPAYLGVTVADSIHKEFPNGANVGVIRWNFNHPVVKGRDQGFLNQMKKYPNLKIVASSWMPDPNKADVVAQAMLTQHPEINVIYAPWDSPPAEGIVSAIRAAGKAGSVKVATMDLGNVGAHQIAHKQMIFADSGEAVYEGGRAMAVASALCRLGKPVPKWLIVPTFSVDRSNLDSAWTYMHGPTIALPKADQVPGS